MRAKRKTSTTGVMKNISILKIGYLTAFIYTLIIGVGMYTVYYINGVRYSNPKIVEIHWPFELVGSIFAIAVVVKFFSWKEVGFTKLNLKQALWLIPIFGILVGIWAEMLSIISGDDIKPDQWRLFAMVGFTTLLVGFSEELVYRGIVLSAFLRENKPVAGILVSAITFSLLHSVNILAGLAFSEIITQIVITFLFGLLFGLLRIKIKNIIPLMIFHWLWDFALIGSGALQISTSTGFFGLMLILFELLFVIIMLPLFIRIQRNNSFQPTAKN